MHRLLAASTIVALWLAPAPSAAQGPEPARPPIGRSPAAALLAARSALGLAPEQVSRLEALAAAQGRAMPGNPGDGLRARADLMDAMKGEGDAGALRKAMDRMHQLRTERALAMLKARQDARAVLTAEQRAKADAFRANRRMQGGMRGGRRGEMRGGMRGRAPEGWRGRARQGPPPEGVISPRRQPPSDGLP